MLTRTRTVTEMSASATRSRYRVYRGGITSGGFMCPTAKVFFRFCSLVFTLLVAACGGGGGGGGGGPVSSLALFAGDMGGSGNVDGVGAAARFNTPFGVATDSAGNVYVADNFNHTIPKITPSGLVRSAA